MRITDKRKAQLLGKHTVKLMKTKGWKVHTWENPHWYVYIHKGLMTIRPEMDLFNKISYTVTLSKYHLGASDPEWNINTRFTDPNKAVDAAIKLAKKTVKHIDDVIAQVKA